ncbi:MAG: serine hydrolase domain-containing protein [Bacillota bacterium]
MILVIAVGLVFLPASGAAALINADALDELLRDRVDSYLIPGLSVAIAHEGEIIYSQAFGEGVDRETRFYIGSVTKSFTALAIMQLVEQDMVDLDEAVSVHIPEFTLSDQITVRHLLYHMSGMTEYDYMPSLRAESGYEELIQDMQGMRIRHEPGTRFSYFNPNYSLLGMIIEKVSGTSYSQYLETNILDPLGLDHTSVRGEVDIVGHLSLFGFTVKRHEPVLNYRLPSGYLTSTAEDLARYMELLRARAPELGVSPEAVALMQSGEPYGMGWIVGDRVGHPDIHHAGSLPGFRSEAIMLRDGGYSIAILTNKNHVLYSFYAFPKLAETIVSELLGEDLPRDTPLIAIMRGLLVALLLMIVVEVLRLRSVVICPHPRSMRRRLLVMNLAVLLTVFQFVPMAVKYLSRRGFAWRMALLQAPDLMIMLFAIVVFNTAKAMVHISHLVRSREEDEVVLLDSLETHSRVDS